MEYVSGTHNDYVFEFERVTAILGANGSGKSRLLQSIKTHLQQTQGNRSVVFVEGGRTVSIDHVLQIDQRNYNHYRNLDVAISNYDEQKASFLVKRLEMGLLLLLRKGQEVRIDHSKAVEAWVENGKVDQIPSLEQPPLERLFSQFNEIFPKIMITHDEISGTLTATKENISYPISSLSDGEKQSLALLTDFLELSNTFRYVVADEPEINLHPSLAERLWSYLEAEYPDVSFIYGSHSINFALRSNVESIYVLSDSLHRIERIKDIHELNREELAPFLSGLPGLLSSSKAIITEGHEESFDPIFYRWLLEEDSIEVLPVGDCYGVRNVANQTGLWGNLKTDLSLTGVIDADFRPKEYLSQFIDEKLTILKLHEAESYLCFPNVLVAVGNHIGSQSILPTEEELINLIIENLESSKLKISARRLFAKLNINLGVSLPRSLISSLDNKEDLLTHIRTASHEEVNKAKEKFSDEQIESILDKELANMDNVIKTSNFEKALIYLPGKQLLNSLSSKVGCKNGTDLIRAVKNNFSPSEFPHIKELRGLLSSKFE